ncbi:MAG: phosphoribosylglycinamide synthetase C domain-containing protein, partial [Solirubrobacterales bacterium]
IGPEAALVAGLVDALEDAGVPAFGPRAAAAELEGSKAFAKELMAEAGVPTASHVLGAAGELAEITHAGTAERDGEIVTAGGRVLNVTGLGPTPAAARDRAYDAASRISFDGMQMRSDIAARAVERVPSQPTRKEA